MWLKTHVAIGTPAFFLVGRFETGPVLDADQQIYMSGW